jgi:putative tryptophan/tyrosine transport system substrate-binding protein
MNFRVSRTASLALAVCAANAANASGVVALSDPHVAQYAEAITAAQEVVPGLTQIDCAAPDAVDQTKRAAPAVILAVGQKALQVARDSFSGTPTVYCMVLARNVAPSKILTGVPLEVRPAEQLIRFKEVDSAAKRIGLLFDPKADAAFQQDAQRAASTLGIVLVAKAVNDGKELQSAVAEIAGSIDALWLVPNPRLVSKEVFDYLLVFTLERHLALFGFLDSFTQAGALASVAPDYRDIGRRAGQLANQIAAKPESQRLPVPAPVDSGGALSINTRTAEKLGISVPPTALTGARKVFQ